MELKNKKILITGGNGFLGKSVCNILRSRGVPDESLFVPSSKEIDLRTHEGCKKAVTGMDIVIHLAASVGGIGANREHPGKFFYENAIMGLQLMEAARASEVKKFVALGTVCAYPKFTPVPFKEDNLWDGYPEETNAPYGLAKKMLLVQAQAYRQEYGFNAIYLLPVNLYGPEDNFNLTSSHVIPALIRKFDDALRDGASSVLLWGTGTPTREFLYVDDAAEAIVRATESYDNAEPINIGSGMEISIKDLAQLIAKFMNYTGVIEWDTTKPDGQLRRRLDVSRAEKEFNFRASMSFEEGLKKTINWYRKQFRVNN